MCTVKLKKDLTMYDYFCLSAHSQHVLNPNSSNNIKEQLKSFASSKMKDSFKRINNADLNNPIVSFLDTDTFVGLFNITHGSLQLHIGRGNNYNLQTEDINKRALPFMFESMELGEFETNDCDESSDDCEDEDNEEYRDSYDYDENYGRAYNDH
jgi:hypothetical protein